MENNIKNVEKNKNQFFNSQMIIGAIIIGFIFTYLYSMIGFDTATIKNYSEFFYFFISYSILAFIFLCITKLIAKSFIKSKISLLVIIIVGIVIVVGAIYFEFVLPYQKMIQSSN